MMNRFSAMIAVIMTVLIAFPIHAATEEENILVVGASGRSGVYLVKALEEQGRNFKPATSNAVRARSKVPGDYDWVEMDVREPASVEAAMKGITHIISALGATTFEGPNSPEFVDWGGNRNLIDAAKAAGVKHFVMLSAAGVTRAEGHIMNRMGGVMTFKLKAEDYLRASGVPYTIVRPGGLESEPSDKRGIELHQGDDLPNHGGFSREDLAAIMTTVVGDSQAFGKSFEPIYYDAVPADGWREALPALKTDEQLSQESK